MELLELEMAEVSEQVKIRVKTLIKELEQKAIEVYGSSSLKNLENLTGVSHEAFRSYRNGKPPGGQVLRKLAEPLGKDPTSLQIYIETGVYDYDSSSSVSEKAVTSYLCDLDDNSLSKVMAEVYRKRSQS